MRLLIVLAAVAALVVAFVLLRPSDDDDARVAPPTAEPITTTTRTDTQPPGTTETVPTTTAPERVALVVRVRDGRPVGGIVRATATQGESILLIVRSDVADHVHVHGYDLFGDVAPGSPARMQFRARLTGRFEIELEDRHEQIAQLTVVP